jgi:dynein heavy chain
VCENTPQPDSGQLEARLQDLINSFTLTLYRTVCRSLFENHKLLLSFLFTARILQGEGMLDAQEWRFLLTGGIILDSSSLPANPTKWLNQKAWTEICGLSKLSAFVKLQESFVERTKDWQDLYDRTSFVGARFPAPFADASSFHKLLIVRCMRPDAAVPVILAFIMEKLGAQYTEPPPFDLKASYADSNAMSPLVFILSPGTDPVADMLAFAASVGFDKKLRSISLGQGQGSRAESLIDEAVARGTWVLLQNCHLALSWLPTLEQKVDSITADRCHPHYRMWLTSAPTPVFPVSVLQNSIKITNAPPKGLKANLMRSYLGLDPQFLQECSSKPVVFRKLLFALCYFHAVVQERRKFGALGWNIPYEWTENDLRISMRQLAMFLNNADDVPWKALLYVTGQVNYGGRVTDERDARTAEHILSDFYSARTLHDRCSLSTSSAKYHVPDDGDLDSYIAFISGLPLTEPAELFGLHDNAEIVYAQSETSSLFSTILSLQPRSASVAGMSADEMLTNLCKDILKRLPPNFDVDGLLKRFEMIYNESMNTVLLQDLVRCVSAFTERTVCYH